MKLYVLIIQPKIPNGEVVAKAIQWDLQKNGFCAEICHQVVLPYCLKYKPHACVILEKKLEEKILQLHQCRIFLVDYSHPGSINTKDLLVHLITYQREISPKRK
jgi:hypothetical protein